MALIRQALVAGYLKKEIETYGVIRVSSRGHEFIQHPVSFTMAEDHSYEESDEVTLVKARGQGDTDQVLMRLLVQLRKEVAKANNVPPYAVFQEYSLQDICLKYPLTFDELVNINGVGEGKAKRYGNQFIDLINQYVIENEIIRPDDLVVKSTGINSSLKLYLIQSIDRKLPLEDIASAKGMKMEELINEMETIVFAGTRLNINYFLEDIFDDDQVEELYDYFIDAETDSLNSALDAFDGDYEEEELRLYRIKFLSEIAN
jgi:ATP-dependent DNA helicase RecQ